LAILNYYKPLGWTPLECIEEIKRQRPEYTDSPMTYTGRLDPMAEGVIVFLTDEDRFKKPDFQKLNKTYEATILFGLSSDTYDSLGLLESGGVTTEEHIKASVEQLQGEHLLPFPPYSSYKIQGKPLHWWAREGRLNEIDIPMKHMTVLNTPVATVSSRTLRDIREHVLRRINLVRGDFRQEETQRSWETIDTQEQQLLIATVTLEVTSGTYIRSLAHLLGQELGCGALLLELRRTAVGTYHQKNSERFDV